MECWDVSTAFLYARLFGDRDTDLGGNEIFMRPPKILVETKVVDDGVVWRLKRLCTVNLILVTHNMVIQNIDFRHFSNFEDLQKIASYSTCTESNTQTLSYLMWGFARPGFSTPYTPYSQESSQFPVGVSSV